jgi:hypothetical protein
MGLAPQISDLVKAQESWKKNLTGLNMLSEIAKSINHEPIFHPAQLSAIEAISKSIALQPKVSIPTTAIEAITKSMALQSKISIPKSAIDAISLISQKHNQFFTNLKTITASLNVNNPGLSQMNSLRLAMNSISVQLGAIAATHKDSALLDDFQNISQQALEISDNFSSDIVLTEEESRRFESLIEYILNFLKKNKKFGTNALLFLSVVVNLMALHQYYDFVKEKPAPATKEDLVKFETKMLRTITEKLKEQKEIRIILRVSKVFLKPSTNSIIIEKLPERFEIGVLKVSHKWLYVSYVSPKNEMPQTGWMLKKYTNQP